MSHLKNISILLIIFIFIGCKNEDSIKGDKFYANKKYEKAIEAYNKYLNINPKHSKSLFNKGRAYEELGEKDKALSIFKKVIKENPRHIKALMSIGNLYYNQKKYENAAYYFEKAIKVDNNLAEAYFMAARSHHKSGNITKAMKAYNDAIDLNNQLGEAYLYRGALKIYLNRDREGCSDLRIAQSMKVNEAKEALNKYCR